MVRGPSPIPIERMRRILVIKPSSLGDVVHSLPAVAMLRHGIPDVYLAWMVEEAAAGILAGNPHLDEVILSGRKRWLKELRKRSTRSTALREIREFLRGLRARRFDLVIDLQGLLKSGIPALLSGAPYRLGFARAREWSNLLMTHTVAVDDRSMHAVDRYVEIPRFLGLSIHEREFPISISPREEEGADRLLRSSPRALGGAKIVLHGGSRWQSKRWPEERFAELGSLLRSRLGAQLILTGAPEERPLAERIASRIVHPVMMAAGKTSLKELCALLKQADLMITCDSGPMHLAAAMGTPAVALFGPTDPARTGPYGEGHRVLRRPLDCAPCFRRHCPDNRCLKEITAEEVFLAAAAALRVRGSLPVEVHSH